MGICSCPTCQTSCFRSDSDKRLGVMRVSCPICTRRRVTGASDGARPSQFCFTCTSPWRNSESFKECGNPCSNDVQSLKLLAEAPLKTICEGVTFPSRRACPNCGSLIEHTSACKHIMCMSKVCQLKVPAFQFCMMCLKPKSESWACGGAYSPCPGGMADRQKQIPRVE